MITLLYPEDKEKNADVLRRLVPEASPQGPRAAAGVAPLLAKVMKDDAAPGMPPAYLTKPEEDRA